MKNKDLTFMEIAKIMSESSYCEKSKVGAVIVKDERIISTGYNGTPSGLDNICEDCIGQTRNNVIHAEMNAILFAAKNGLSLNGSTLYVTMSPCKECAKNIIQSGIKEVVYSVKYRDDTGIKVLEDAGIKIRRYK